MVNAFENDRWNYRITAIEECISGARKMVAKKF